MWAKGVSPLKTRAYLLLNQSTAVQRSGENRRRENVRGFKSVSRSSEPGGLNGAVPWDFQC